MNKAILQRFKKNSLPLSLTLLASFINATTQLLWKYSHRFEDNLIFAYFLIGSGFFLYGLSTLILLKAFRMGDYNVLHPSLAVTYFFSSFYAYFLLQEVFQVHQIAGIALIILGVIVMGGSTERK